MQAAQPCDPGDPASRPEAFYIFTFVLPASCQAPPRLPACTRQPSPEVREETKMRWGGMSLEPTVNRQHLGHRPLSSPQLGHSPSPVGLWFLLVGSGGLEHCGQGRTPPHVFPRSPPSGLVVQPPAAEEARPIGRWCFCFLICLPPPSPQLQVLENFPS